MRDFGAKLQEQIHSLLYSSKTCRGFNFPNTTVVHAYTLVNFKDFTSAKLVLLQVLELTLGAILFLVLSFKRELHDSPNISVLCSELVLNSDDGSRQRVLITRVPQTKTNWPSKSTQRKEEEKKKKAGLLLC